MIEYDQNSYSHNECLPCKKSFLITYDDTDIGELEYDTDTGSWELLVYLPNSIEIACSHMLTETHTDDIDDAMKEFKRKWGHKYFNKAFPENNE